MHKSFYGHMFSFLLDKNLGVGWLGDTVGAHLTFYETAKLFSKVIVQFCIITGNV